MAIDQLHHSLGRRIKALRRQRGLSQEALAAEIDRSVETVSNIERGEVTTRLTTVSAIIGALGVEAAELFDRRDPRVAHPGLQELVELLTDQDDRLIDAVVAQAKVLLGLAGTSPKSRKRAGKRRS